MSLFTYYLQGTCVIGMVCGMLGKTNVKLDHLERNKFTTALIERSLSCIVGGLTAPLYIPTQIFGYLVFQKAEDDDVLQMEASTDNGLRYNWTKANDEESDEFDQSEGYETSESEGVESSESDDDEKDKVE